MGEIDMDNYYGGFGTRRKRNLNLSNRNEVNSGTSNHGINWGSYETEDEDESKYNHDTFTNIETEDEALRDDIEEETLEVFQIEGKPFKLKAVAGKKKFSDTHVRFTTYLEKDLHNTIQLMNKQGYFDSITQFINDSVKAYLLEHYSA
jgi:hypothetical protein